MFTSKRYCESGSAVHSDVCELVASAPPIKPAIDSGALLEGVAPDIFDPTTPQYQGFSLIYNTTFSNTEPALASTTSFDAALTIMLAMSGVPAGDSSTMWTMSSTVI